MTFKDAFYARDDVPPLATGKESYITTYTGIRFDPKMPTFNIEDIAHALSMLCRYNGHCNDFYSVAEHSVLVARLMKEFGGDRHEQFEGLMHDASEAYLSDVPSPFKQFLPDWSAFEKPIEAALYAYYGIERTKMCKYADMLALVLEGRWLLPNGDRDFIVPEELREHARILQRTDRWLPRCWSPRRAKEIFLELYEGLSLS